MAIPFRYDLEHTFYHKDENGDPDEHANWQRLLISDGKGGFIELETADAITDDELAQERPTLKAFDIVEADVILHVGEWIFPRTPVAGEVVYWNEGRKGAAPNQVYTILKVTREECALVLALSSNRAGLFTHSLQ